MGKVVVTKKNLVVKSAVKEFIKDNELNMSLDFVEYLNKKLVNLVKGACKRCIDNKRKTLKPFDI